jgi:hypothetical protein
VTPSALFPKCHSSAKLPTENGGNSNVGVETNCNSTISGLGLGGGAVGGDASGGAAAGAQTLCIDVATSSNLCDPATSQCCTTGTKTKPPPGIREVQFFVREWPAGVGARGAAGVAARVQARDGAMGRARRRACRAGARPGVAPPPAPR